MLRKTIPIWVESRKKRHSGIELLRIIAMFLVLVVHAGFFSLGAPTYEDILSDSLPSFMRVLFQSFSIGCVDIFVLISGWFGIRPKKLNICKFIYQCLFFLIGIYVFCLIFGFATFSLKGVAGCFLLLKWNWFIKAYLLLYIISPMLNAYIDSSTEKQHRMLLIYFYLFQTVYSWFSNAAFFFEHGYSTISFVGLYLLARYFAKYNDVLLILRRSLYLWFFIVSTFLMAIIYFVAIRYHLNAISGRLLQYDQPLVIIGSLSLVIYFSKLNIKSSAVNWVASSSFAVFLLHTNPNLCLPYFVPTINNLYISYNGISCIGVIFIYLVSIYVLAIAIDQIRKLGWYWLNSKTSASFAAG